MKRFLVIILTLLVLVLGLYFFDQYWIHRYDSLIAREAAAHHIDPDLVWSIAYKESYFSPWKNGKDGEIGLMQVRPAVAHDWATDTDQRTTEDSAILLRDPERNIQIGCWYLEKFSDEYRDAPGREARMLAAYNAGPKRAADWSRVAEGAPPLTEQEFITRIDFPSTRAYVASILDRYRRLRSSRIGAPAGATPQSGR
ncbi:MAG TPA: lytic transglycosylase domain-containing protein [Pyrinomonadaceae bacterium]|nr:lytic transglycosylase domain-containing protein [Pyrinomonadaceae bacterium]